MGHPFQTLEADAAPFDASPTHRTNSWQTRLRKPVVAAKLRNGFAAHVALQHGRLGFSQVDQHQSVALLDDEAQLAGMTLRHPADHEKRRPGLMRGQKVEKSATA